jgi:hypothetical protein
MDPAISRAWIGDGDCVPEDETPAGRTINASKTRCFDWIAMSLNPVYFQELQARAGMRYVRFTIFTTGIFPASIQR